MSLSSKPCIANLLTYEPPTAPPGAQRVVGLSSRENPPGPSPELAEIDFSGWADNRFSPSPFSARTLEWTCSAPRQAAHTDDLIAIGKTFAVNAKTENPIRVHDVEEPPRKVSGGSQLLRRFGVIL
jgi:hypothetical protein